MFVKMIVRKKEGDHADATTTIAECARLIRRHGGDMLTLEGAEDGGAIDHNFKGVHRVAVYVMSDTGATIDHFTLSPSG
jgi:hypothetical protein